MNSHYVFDLLFFSFEFLFAYLSTFTKGYIITSAFMKKKKRFILFALIHLFLLLLLLFAKNSSTFVQIYFNHFLSEQHHWVFSVYSVNTYTYVAYMLVNICMYPWSWIDAFDRWKKWGEKSDRTITREKRETREL